MGSSTAMGMPTTVTSSTMVAMHVNGPEAMPRSSEASVRRDEVTAMRASRLGKSAAVGDAIAAGHRLARDLQMQPGNVCTPSYLADQAKQLAAAHGFTVTVLDRAAIRQEAMGALLAVAQGSAQEIGRA